MDDLYISADIEADGPIPGRHSMLSFGLVVAGRFDGATFEPFGPGAETFYRELQPIAEEVSPEALVAAGLDRDKPRREGAEPADAMRAAAAWVAAQAGPARREDAVEGEVSTTPRLGGRLAQPWLQAR